jgi:hypothetical protein
VTTLQTIFISTLLITLTLKGQVNDFDIRQDVLEKAIVDSEFVFGKWTATGGTETHLKFIGQVTTANGRVFKMLNYCWVWGLSQRATNRILIFNANNKYVGNYYVGSPYDLPDKLENGKLIFENNDNPDCDKNLETKGDFAKGLPKEFFVKCKGKHGDIYSFSTE